MKYKRYGVRNREIVPLKNGIYIKFNNKYLIYSKLKDFTKNQLYKYMKLQDEYYKLTGKMFNCEYKYNPDRFLYYMEVKLSVLKHNIHIPEGYYISYIIPICYGYNNNIPPECISNINNIIIDSIENINTNSFLIKRFKYISSLLINTYKTQN